MTSDEASSQTELTPARRGMRDCRQAYCGPGPSRKRTSSVATPMFASTSRGSTALAIVNATVAIASLSLVKNCVMIGSCTTFDVASAQISLISITSCTSTSPLITAVGCDHLVIPAHQCCLARSAASMFSVQHSQQDLDFRTRLVPACARPFAANWTTPLLKRATTRAHLLARISAEVRARQVPTQRRMRGDLAIRRVCGRSAVCVCVV